MNMISNKIKPKSVSIGKVEKHSQQPAPSSTATNPSTHMPKQG